MEKKKEFFAILQSQKKKKERKVGILAGFMASRRSF